MDKSCLVNKFGNCDSCTLKDVWFCSLCYLPNEKPVRTAGTADGAAAHFSSTHSKGPLPILLQNVQVFSTAYDLSRLNVDSKALVLQMSLPCLYPGCELFCCVFYEGRFIHMKHFPWTTNAKFLG